MEKLKVGIIGAGRIGQVHAKSITYHIPQAEIVSISDIYVDGAKKVAQELGIPNYYEDYHEILNNPEINAVLICSSTDTHADIAVEAAKAGKNIFCEKPVDLTVAKIKKVIEAVDEAGVKLQIGFNRRYDHNFAEIKNLENKGKIGELQTIKITSRDPEPPPISYVKVSGGIFLDMPVHALSAVRLKRFMPMPQLPLIRQSVKQATLILLLLLLSLRAAQSVLLITAVKLLTDMTKGLKCSAVRVRQVPQMTLLPTFHLLTKRVI